MEESEKEKQQVNRAIAEKGDPSLRRAMAEMEDSWRRTPVGEAIDFADITMYPYGKLMVSQLKTLQKFVDDKVVYDMGAGRLHLAQSLVAIGAAHVHAIDSEGLWKKGEIRGITKRKMNFDEFIRTEKPSPGSIGFFSWPDNSNNWALPALMEKFTVIAYLGKNTDGTMCGIREMWPPLFRRMVLSYIPHTRNTLIIYGPDTGHIPYGRTIRGEELGGLDGLSIHTFMEAEEIAKDYEPLLEEPYYRRREQKP